MEGEKPRPFQLIFLFAETEKLSFAAKIWIKSSTVWEVAVTLAVSEWKTSSAAKSVCMLVTRKRIRLSCKAGNSSWSSEFWVGVISGRKIFVKTAFDHNFHLSWGSRRSSLHSPCSPESVILRLLHCCLYICSMHWTKNLRILVYFWPKLKNTYISFCAHANPSYSSFICLVKVL